MNHLRIHNTKDCVRTLGPGTRFVVWLQGCNRRCKGCMSPESRPIDGGTLISVEYLVNEICSVNDIEGVTISGGEPFLQTEALHELLAGLRKKSNLGVIIYTGFTLDELHGLNNPLIENIISSLSDIIIDGEYIEDLNDGTSLKGSANQVVHYITDRYLPFQDIYEGTSRNVEVFVEDGEAFLVGVPNKETLESWKTAVQMIPVSKRHKNEESAL